MKKIYALLALVSGMISSAYAQCSLYPVPLSARLSASSLVLEGKVVSSQSFWNAAHNYIYTSNLVEVAYIFKGSLSSMQIEVITEGGEIGLKKQTVEPSLQLKKDDEGVFTLNLSEGIPSQFGYPTYRVYADVQGFIKYDPSEDRAYEPFRKYKSIKLELYPELENLLGEDFREYSSDDQKYGQGVVASISGISPLNITAGTSSIVTITGAGFGALQGTSTVEFFNADDGGATYIKPHSSQYVSWNNTQIQVMVPTKASTVAGTAGTGPVRVTVAGSSTVSIQTLTVDYGELNVYYSGNNTIYNTRHVDLNGSAGVTWQMYTSFDANASAKAAFIRSFQTWRCNTYINWILGSVTSTNVIASDGVNVIRFDIGSELPVGVLGRCTSYYSGCIIGVNVYWFVDELDICFDDPATSAITWQFGPSAATGSQYDFESVSLHELGHGHQLSHVINTNDVMHYALANAQNKRSLITQNINAGNDVMSRNVSPGVCSMSAMTALSASICLTAAPTASFNLASSTVCAGQAVALNDLSTDSPTSWSWTLTGGSPATSTLQNTSVTYAAAGLYSISLIATNGFGSSTALTKTISVIAVPVLNAASATICSGSSTLITASGATSFTWNPGNLIGASQNLNPSSSTVYTVTGSNGSCSSSATSNVSVTTTPTVLVPNANICSGNSTLVTASGANSYIWNPGTLSGASQNLSPGATTIYTVTGSIGSCTSTAFSTVSVTTMPSVSVSDASICSGTSTLITAGGATSFVWNPGGLSGASQNLNPGSTTIYTVIGSNGSCTNSATSTVSVTTTPTVLVPNANLCSGSSTLVAASGATSYVWNPGALSGALQNLNPGATTIYTVTGSIGSCTSSALSTVSVTTMPTVSVADASICSGTSTLITASGATSFVWNPGGLGGASQNLNPGSTTIYTVIGSNGSCTNSATSTVSVTATPTVLVPNANLCSGSSTLVAASGATSYVWNPGALSGASQNLNPGATTIYTVTGSIGSCTSSALSTVSVTTMPTVSVADASICSGTSTLITASGAISFVWNPGGLGGASQNLNPGSTTIYTVTGSNGSCTHSAISTVSVSTTPTILVPDANLCSGNSTLITASGATSYVWNPGGLSGAAQVLNPGSTIIYTVTGSIGSCTSSALSTVSVTTTPTLSVADASICSGTSTLITAGGANSYVWNPGLLNGASQSLNPGSTTVYTITGSIGSCTNSATSTVSVTTTPTINVPNAGICSGTSTLITASGANSYTWNPGSLNGPSQTLSPASTLVYTISGSIGTCTNSTTASISVTTTPTVSVPNATVCAGSPTLITASGAGTYSWSPGGLSGASQNLNPTSTTIYTIEGRNGNCLHAKNFTITAITLPSIFALASPPAICASQTANLLGGGGITYTWVSGAPGFSLTGNPAVVIPSVTTLYTVSATDGTCTNTSTVSLTVNPLPPVTMNLSSLSLCSGNTATLTASGADSYTWTPGNQTSTVITVAPSITTGYTLAGSYTATGCSRSVSAVINVTQTPVVSANAIQNIICAGETSSLIASGATSYSWAPGSLTGSMVVVTPSVPGQYYVVTGANGVCTATNAVTVLVNPTPTLSVSGLPATICQGSNTVVASFGADSYTWNPGNIVRNNIVNTATLSPSATTIYTLTGITASSGCTSSLTRTLSVTPSPTLSASVSPTQICSGSTATLSATGASAGYTWSPTGNLSSTAAISPATSSTYVVTGSNGTCTSVKSVSILVYPGTTLSVPNASICSGTSSMVIANGALNYTWLPVSTVSSNTLFASPLSTTVYTITGQNAFNCYASTTATVFVTQTPSPGITALSPTLCSGLTTTLTANNVSTYTWLPSGLTASAIMVGPAGTTSYTLLGQNGNCFNTQVLTLTVIPTPVISVPGASVCSGNSMTLTASGASTYTWLTGNLTGATQTFTPLVTTVYAISGSSAGCNASASATITVAPTPTLSVTANPAAICVGQSSTLQASGALNYLWAFSSAPGFSAAVTPTLTTNYTVYGSIGSCTSSAQVPVTVNPNPTVSLSSSSNSICPGGTVSIHMSSLAGSGTYTINPGSFTLSTPNVTLGPSATTTYSISDRDPFTGCTDTAFITFSVLSNPTITAASNVTTLCSGSTATLTGSGAGSFTWIPGSLSGTSVVISPSVNTTYTVTGSNGSCTHSLSLTQSVIASPDVSVSALTSTICTGETVIINSSGASSYTYFPGNMNGSSVSITPSVTTTYTVSGENNGCYDDATISVSVSLCEGIGPDLALQDLKVYPNPARNSVTVDLGRISKGEITLFSTLGQVLATEKIYEVDKAEMDLKDYPEGIYFIKVDCDGGKPVIIRLIKE